MPSLAQHLLFLHFLLRFGRLQASVSVAVIFISYILHQRYQPFLMAKAFSDFAMKAAVPPKSAAPCASLFLCCQNFAL